MKPFYLTAGNRTMRKIQNRKLLTKLTMYCLVFAILPVLAAVGVDITFEEVYPPSFWDTAIADILIALGFALVFAGAAAFTVATAGTGGAMLGAAGAWFTTVGSFVGGLAGVGSGAAAAGLAILGGGTIASGGFGMAGGIFVISALTGAATGVVADVAYKEAQDQLINKPYTRYEFIKVPLSEEGSDAVVELVSKLAELDADLEDGDIKAGEYKAQLNEIAGELSWLLKNACDNIEQDEDSVFDAVNAAIYAHNIGDGPKVKSCLKTLELHASNGSFLSYLASLDYLADGDYQEAYKKLDLAIAREPSALQPYILYTMALNDNKEYLKVIKIASDGLDNVDDDNFNLLFSRAKAYYQLERYLEAAEDFTEAYDEVSENYVEVDTAMMAAISYLKGGEVAKGRKWHEKAIKKVEGKDDMETETLKVEISERWNCLVNTSDLSEKCQRVRAG